MDLKKFEDPLVLSSQHTVCLENDFNEMKCPTCHQRRSVPGDLENVSRNVSVLVDLKKSENEKETCVVCKSHEGDSVVCICCEERICKKCNNSHLQQTKKRLEKLGFSLKVHLSMEKEILHKITQTSAEVDKKKSEIIMSINDCINNLVNILQKRKEDLVKKVEKEFIDNYSTLKSSQETKEVDIAVLSSSIYSIKSILEMENIKHAEVHSLYKSVQNTMPPKSNQDLLKDFQIKNIAFSYDIEHAKECLSKIGTVTYNTKISSQKQPILNDFPNNIIIPLAPTNDIGNSPRPLSNSPILRNATFIINRPSKSISFEISANELIYHPVKSLNSSLHSAYLSKSSPILIFGTKGTGPGEFIWPRGIVVDNEKGKIVVADSSNHRIQIFSESGVFEKVICQIIAKEDCDNSNICKTNFDCVSGVTVDGHNRIICSDRYNHRVVIMDEDGRLVNELGKGSNDEALLSYPWGISVDIKGNILICDKDNHRIQVFSRSGDYIKQIGAFGKQQGYFDNPHYLCVCQKSHNIYVSDTSNHRIQVFNAKGEFLNSFCGDGPPKLHLKYPRGISIDDEGNVLVCDSGNNRISIFSDKGKMIHMLGSHGSGIGQFKGLEGISVFKDGRIVVTDRDNHRIQIF